MTKKYVTKRDANSALLNVENSIYLNCTCILVMNLSNAWYMGDPRL